MAEGEGRGHVQSVIVSGVLILASLFFFALAVLAHLLRINRRMLEEICSRARETHLQPPSPADDAAADSIQPPPGPREPS